MPQITDIFSDERSHYNHNTDCTKCSQAGVNREGEDRYSGGYYAGRFCDEHWRESPIKKDWQYDYLDAGEHLDDY